MDGIFRLDMVYFLPVPFICDRGIEMKKCIIFCILTLTVFIQVYPEIVANLPDLGKPSEIRINNGYLFVSDQQSVRVYDLKSFKQVKKLCRKGEGPGEFQRKPRIEFSSDKLVLSDSYKIILFSREFEYLREIRLGTVSSRALPIGDRFVITNPKAIGKKSCRVFLLIDKNGRKITDLVIESLGPQIRNYFLTPLTWARSWNDKVFIAQPHKGFYIDVFDKHGKKLYHIDKKVKKIKAEKKHKQAVLNELLFSVGRSRFERARKLGAFDRPMKEFAPAIRNFWVVEDNIYVKTFDIIDTQEKYIVMDLKGDIQKTLFLPIVFKELLTFHNDTFYYLDDNEEKESWVLHAVQL